MIPASRPLTISTTFRLGKKIQFLSGLAFSSSDSNLELSFYEHSNAKSTAVCASEYLMGFVMALTAEGIIGIHAVTRNKAGTRSEMEYADLEGNVDKELLSPATPSCKTLDESAELATDPVKFCLTHRQMRAKDIFVT